MYCTHADTTGGVLAMQPPMNLPRSISSFYRRTSKSVQ